MSALRDSCRRFDQRESSLKLYTVEILCADFVFGRSLNLHVDWKDLASFTAWSGARLSSSSHTSGGRGMQQNQIAKPFGTAGVMKCLCRNTIIPPLSASASCCARQELRGLSDFLAGLEVSHFKWIDM